MEARTLVTDIQRFCVNDGPGFRTNVYLKGCALRCRWCHNPEAMSPQPELYWKRRACVQCGACLVACPRDAIRPPISPMQAQQEGSTYYKIIWERCDQCMKCVEACTHGGLMVVGQPMSWPSVLPESNLRREPRQTSYLVFATPSAWVTRHHGLGCLARPHASRAISAKLDRIPFPLHGEARSFLSNPGSSHSRHGRRGTWPPQTSASTSRREMA